MEMSVRFEFFEDFSDPQGVVKPALDHAEGVEGHRRVGEGGGVRGCIGEAETGGGC